MKHVILLLAATTTAMACSAGTEQGSSDDSADTEIEYQEVKHQAEGSVGELPAVEAESSDPVESSHLLQATTDPLGIPLADVGIVAGAPCGSRDHVASVTDAEGRYFAFCAAADGALRTVQTAAVHVDPLDTVGRSPLSIFVELTPDSVEVPAALITEGQDPTLLEGRTVVQEPVLFRDPATAPREKTIDGLIRCASGSSFENLDCPALENLGDVLDAADSMSWCSTGLYTSAQRTGSSQGVPNADLGRMSIAACGTAPTRIRQYVRGAVTGSWHTDVDMLVDDSTWTIVEIWADDVVQSGQAGTNLRLRVDSQSGGNFRYAGSYVRF